MPDHIGNPYDRCRKPECLIDPDCSTTLTCRNEKCVDPCDCAQNADCTPRNHRGICKCRPGFTGDPYGIACTPSKKFDITFLFIRKLDFIITHWPLQTLRPELIFILVPPPPDPGCKEDRECASKEACFDRECKNPCLAIKPCARNAKCEVHSSLPLRTMSCTCLPGFTGKGDLRCDKIRKSLVFSKH